MASEPAALAGALSGALMTGCSRAGRRGRGRGGRGVGRAGGGRVGRSAAKALQERGIDYRIVEKDASRVKDFDRTVIGSAADLFVLESAGIRQAPTTIVTTSDDATNIYLTIYCRRLRPDMQIISRSNLERNVSTLHRAGADFVMSYASMGASAVFNLLEQDDVVMVAEGLDVFRCPVPRALCSPLSALRSPLPASINNKSPAR